MLLPRFAYLPKAQAAGQVDMEQVYTEEVSLEQVSLARYAVALTEELYRKERVGLHFYTEVVRGTGSRHRGGGKRSQAHAITYGREGLLWAYQYGSVGSRLEQECVWRGVKRGYEGVWRVVLHEFAHVLQVDRDERWKGSVHNRYFVAILRRLVQNYPFESFGPERFTR